MAENDYLERLRRIAASAPVTPGPQFDGSKLLIIYAEDGQRFAELLQKQAKVWSRTSNMTLEAISVGSELMAHITAKTLVVIILSPDFLNSDVDFKLAEKLDAAYPGKRVVPVLGIPCDVPNSPYVGLQALPQGGRGMYSWLSEASNLESTMLSVVKALQSIPKIKEVPCK